MYINCSLGCIRRALDRDPWVSIDLVRGFVRWWTFEYFGVYSCNCRCLDYRSCSGFTFAHIAPVTHVYYVCRWKLHTVNVAVLARNARCTIGCPVEASTYSGRSQKMNTSVPWCSTNWLVFWCCTHTFSIVNSFSFTT